MTIKLYSGNTLCTTIEENDKKIIKEYKRLNSMSSDELKIEFKMNDDMNNLFVILDEQSYKMK
jgi:hypothetical protein